MKKILAVAVLVVLSGLGVGCGGKTPDPTPLEQARAKVAQVANERQAASLINRTIALPVACGDVVDEAFDVSTGLARIYVFAKPGHPIECYDYPGHSRSSGSEFTPITPEQVEIIRKNECGCYPKSQIRCVQPSPPPIVMPMPPPVAAATPPPRELGEGPCCRP